MCNISFIMLPTALLVALCIVYTTSSLTPLGAPADDDCALYLTGPGRSSAYDYSLNLLKGNFAYDGQHTCITYDAINQAYLDARTRILVSEPKGDWKAEDFASVGELILDISISLARTYGLTYEEIEKGLPLIDTSRTLIREVCPPVFSHVECRAGKYRRLDGLCNNLRHPTWGATMAPFQRLIGPLFADGINAPRIAHTGRDLPLSRVVSRTMHPDEGFHDHAGTVMVIAWGQFMDHDYTLTGTPLDPINRNDPEECCKRPPHLKHPYCNEIRVPDDDYFYRLFGVKCIDFVRGFPSPRPGCRLGSRVPFNTLTGAIDGNTVYGVTEKFSRKLRTGYGGFLRMNPVFKEYGLKDLLPLKLDIPDEGCTRPNKNMYCFEAGEIRVNEQLVLTVMHTLMAREHNRVAKALAAVNPHWDDETLFQESRRINIAEIQHITYNEFLPILLGKDVMEKFGLVLQKEGYWDGYDQDVNPDVIASFASAAYRFGHSLLPTAVERWSKAHKFIASKRLSDLIRRPYDLYRAGVLDEYVMGLMNQVAQAMDDSITQEVTNHLFKKVGARFGMDLVSFNMQRGREFGIPGYMEFRKFCGLSGADSFQDLFGSMSNDTIQRYESIFEHPVDVDLWSGGVSERPLAGSMLGPTFACVIATQFSYSRRGDRFWFELPNQPSSFTPEQLAEIRKSRLARVICDNTDIIDTVQLYPMVLPDHELNPRVPCRSGIIPSMDFSKWAEPGPYIGGAKEYITDAYLCDAVAADVTSNNTKSNLNSNNVNLIQTKDYINSTVNTSHQDTQELLPNLLTTNVSIIPESATESINITGISCKNDTKNEDLYNQEFKQIQNNDKILKYVYKIKNDSIVPDKNKSHYKNSLKRKKRSQNTSEEGKHKLKPPQFFDFNVDRGIKNRQELKLPELTPDGIINIANLANFNVQTLHNIKPIPLEDNEENNKNNEKNQHLPLNYDKRNQRFSINENEDQNSEYKENESEEYDEDDIVPQQIHEDRKENIEYTEIPVNQNRPKISNNRYQDAHEHDIIDESDLNEKSEEYQNERRPPKQRINEENIDYEEIPIPINHPNNNKLNTNSGFHDNKNEEIVNENDLDEEEEDDEEAEEEEEEEYYHNNRDSPERDESDISLQNNKQNTKTVDYTILPIIRNILKDNEFNSRNSYQDSRNDKVENENDLTKSRGYFQNIRNPPDYHTNYNKERSDENLDHTDALTHNSDEEEQLNNENGHLDSNEKEITNADEDYIIKKHINVDKKPTKDSNENYVLQNSLPNELNKYDSASPYNRINHNSSVIQEVDLDDFSHERIQLNNKGQVEPAKDLLENFDNDSSVKHNQNTQSNLRLSSKSNNNEEYATINDNHDKNFKEGVKQIKIDNGEIKPVIELNDEDSEDIVDISTEDINAKLKGEIEKKGYINEDAFKKQSNNKLGNEVSKDINTHRTPKADSIKEVGKVNVKNQFERIPKDYNHTAVKPNTTDNNQDNAKKDEDDDDDELEGTLDSFLPGNKNYDEHLNTKFTDLTINLPEIKLPEDILSYAIEDPLYKSYEDENAYGTYISNDKGANNDKKKPKTKEGQDDFYSAYIYKPNEKDQNEDDNYDKDNNEDLYEKFVRERFGKIIPTNTEPEKKVESKPKHINSEISQKAKIILKKAEKLQEEAKKSGDPEANYAWVLEYKEKI